VSGGGIRDTGFGHRATGRDSAFSLTPETRYLTPGIMVCADPLYRSAVLPVSQRALASASSVYRLPNLSTEIFVWRLHYEDEDKRQGAIPVVGT